MFPCRALPPGGRLITLEIDPQQAAMAQRVIEHAGLQDRIEIRIGPADECFPGIVKDYGENRRAL